MIQDILPFLWNIKHSVYMLEEGNFKIAQAKYAMLYKRWCVYVRKAIQQSGTQVSKEED